MKKFQLVNIFILGALLLINVWLLFSVGFSQIIETITTGSDDGLLFGLPSLIFLIVLIFYLVSIIKAHKNKTQADNWLIATSYFINIFILILIILAQLVIINSEGGFAEMLLFFVIILGTPLFILSYALFLNGIKNN